MTVGISSYLANNLLNILRGTAFTPPAGTYVKLHVGDPGAAGTANPSAVTTRNAATFNASTAAALTVSTIAAYAATATETISHISVWDAASGGNFLWSSALTTPKPVNNGDQFALNTVGLALGTIAA